MEKKNKKNWKSAAFRAAYMVFGIVVTIFAYSEHEKRIKAEARADANEKINDKIIREQAREQTKRLAQQSYYNGKSSK